MLFHLFGHVKQAAGTPHYAVGPQYDGIGAGRFIYTGLALAPVRYYGAGKMPASQLRVLQHPQVYVNRAVPLAAMVGVQAGQMFLSPLIQNGG